MSPSPHRHSRFALLAALSAAMLASSGCRQVLGIEDREPAGIGGTGAGGRAGGGGVGNRGGSSGSPAGAGGSSGGGMGADGGTGGTGGTGGVMGGFGGEGATGGTTGGGGLGGTGGKGGAGGKAGAAGAAPVCPPEGQEPSCVAKPLGIDCGTVLGEDDLCAGRVCVHPDNICPTGSLCSAAFRGCVQVSESDCGSQLGKSGALWPMTRYCAAGIGRGRYLVDPTALTGTPEVKTYMPPAGEKVVTSPIVSRSGVAIVVTDKGSILRLPVQKGGVTEDARKAAFAAKITNATLGTSDTPYPAPAFVRPTDETAPALAVLFATGNGDLTLLRFKDDELFSTASGIFPLSSPHPVSPGVSPTSLRFVSPLVVANGGPWAVARCKEILGQDVSCGQVLTVTVEPGGIKIAPRKKTLDPGSSGIAVFDSPAGPATWAIGTSTGSVQFAVDGADPSRIQLEGSDTQVSTPVLVSENEGLRAFVVSAGKLFKVKIPGDEDKVVPPLALLDGVTFLDPPVLRGDGRLVATAKVGATTSRVTLTPGKMDKYSIVSETIPQSTSLFPIVLGTRTSDRAKEISEGNFPIGETLFSAFYYEQTVQHAFRMAATAELGGAQWYVKVLDLKLAAVPTPSDEERARLSPALGKDGKIFFTDIDGNLNELSPVAKP